MQLNEKQLALYEKAHDTLLFDDLYEFILALWPDKLNASNRDHVNYHKMTGIIHGLSEHEEYHVNILSSFDIGYLLIHLNYCLSIAVHKIGLITNLVRFKEINKEYVRFLFESEYIYYTMEEDKEKVPDKIRNNADSIYGKKLVDEYFARNKT